jgi:hypothetical protein
VWLADKKFLVAAFVLHLAVPVAAAVAPEPSWRRPKAAAVAPQSAEIEVDASVLPPMNDERVDRDEPSKPPSPERVPAQDAPRDEGPKEPADSDPTDEPTPTHEPEPIANGAEASPDSFPAPEPGPVPDPMSRPPSQYEVGGPGLGLRPGLGGLPFDALPPDRGGRSAAPTETNKRTYEVEAARRSIDKGLRTKDAQLGLDFPAASAIAAVLREAVRGSDTPFECQGSFSVTVNAGGKVTAVSLGGYAGGDPATWQIVRKAALSQLTSRIFEMKSSFVRGALVGVTIRSEHKMPGGGVSRQGASFSFDVADVGAKPVRVVSMSFSAKPLE